ncbi:hypothetical protein BH09PSE5_BH09PSE5_38800 [soil metagenome]
MRDGWFEGIPYPMQDLRPEGFVGRAFALRNATLLQASADPRDWSDDDALHALSTLDADVSGDLIVGKQAHRRWCRLGDQDLGVVANGGIEPAYALMAERSLRHHSDDCLLGGEFPKFTAVR